MAARKRPPTSGTRHGRGVGKGVGWGGPAKGNGNGNGPHPLIKPGDRIALGGWDREKLKARDERIAALHEQLLAIALTGEREETQVSASVALLNRLEGMPVQRNLMGQDKDSPPLGVIMLPPKSGE